MQNNLKALLEQLLKHEVDFVLAGGLACVVHGSPLVTQDIDICVTIDDKQVAKLREALKDLSPKHRMNPNHKPSFMDYPISLDGVNNIYLETDLGVLDIMSELPPVGNFEAVKSNAIEISLFGHRCFVAGIDDLIRIKETMKRPKDKETLRILKEIKTKSKKD